VPALLAFLDWLNAANSGRFTKAAAHRRELAAIGVELLWKPTQRGDRR
jgi:hypothetical protein